jgi:hypothetical protein
MQPKKSISKKADKNVNEKMQYFSDNDIMNIFILLVRDVCRSRYVLPFEWDQRVSNAIARWSQLEGTSPFNLPTSHG